MAYFPAPTDLRAARHNPAPQTYPQYPPPPSQGSPHCPPSARPPAPQVAVPRYCMSTPSPYFGQPAPFPPFPQPAFTRPGPPSVPLSRPSYGPLVPCTPPSYPISALDGSIVFPRAHPHPSFGPIPAPPPQLWSQQSRPAPATCRVLRLQDDLTTDTVRESGLSAAPLPSEPGPAPADAAAAVPVAQPLSAADRQCFSPGATLVCSPLPSGQSMGAVLGSLVTLVESALRKRGLAGSVVGTRVLADCILLHLSDADTAAAVLKAHQADADSWKLLGTAVRLWGACSVRPSPAVALTQVPNSGSNLVISDAGLAASLPPDMGEGHGKEDDGRKGEKDAAEDMEVSTGGQPEVVESQPPEAGQANEERPQEQEETSSTVQGQSRSSREQAPACHARGEARREVARTRPAKDEPKKRPHESKGEPLQSTRPRREEVEGPRSYPRRSVRLFPVYDFFSTRDVYSALRTAFSQSRDSLIRRRAMVRIVSVQRRAPDDAGDKEFLVEFTDRETAGRVLEEYGNLDSWACHYPSRGKLYNRGKLVAVYPDTQYPDVRDYVNRRRATKAAGDERRELGRERSDARGDRGRPPVVQKREKERYPHLGERPSESRPHLRERMRHEPEEQEYARTRREENLPIGMRGIPRPRKWESRASCQYHPYGSRPHEKVGGTRETRAGDRAKRKEEATNKGSEGERERQAESGTVSAACGMLEEKAVRVPQEQVPPPRPEPSACKVRKDEETGAPVADAIQEGGSSSRGAEPSVPKKAGLQQERFILGDFDLNM